MEELKPCPHCGKIDAIELTDCVEAEGCQNFENCGHEPYVCVVCNVNKGGCGAAGGYAPSEEEATQKWNRRAASENKALTEDQQKADELIRMLIAGQDVNPCEWCCTPDKGGETCRGCFPYEDSNECPSKFTAFSAKSSNEPLTLGQLRKMDVDMKNRRWVWIEALKPFSYEHKVSAYYQVQLDYTQGEAFICGYPGLSFGFGYADYGKTWLAYDRKPEGSENP